MPRLIPVVFAISLLAGPFVSPTDAFRHAAAGAPARDFTLAAADGTTHLLSDSLGEKLTLLLFWATWNGRSLEALRDLEQWHTRFTEQGLRAVSVNVDGEGTSGERRASLDRVRRALRLSHPMLIDEHLDVYASYGVSAVPSIAVIGATGKIERAFAGYPGQVRAALREALAAAFDEARPSPQARADARGALRARTEGQAGAGTVSSGEPSRNPQSPSFSGDG